MTTMTNHSETIKNIYDAFASGDMPTVLGAMAPNFSWTEPEGNPYAGTHVGPDDVLQNVFMKLGSEWDVFAVVPQEYIAQADTVVTLGEMNGTFKTTGKSFKSPFVHVWKFSEGRLKSFKAHLDTVVYQRALQ
jgi:ketosteroid isomerase-like protein